jgi:uncharacterized protein with HEPN domain
MRDERLNDRERLLRMRTAMLRLRAHLQGRSRKDFLRDGVLSDAVLLQFTVLGEEVRYLSTGLLDRHPYPWHQVRAFRNLIAHDCFGVKLEAVWSIITDHLPGLEELVQRILEEEFPEDTA